MKRLSTKLRRPKGTTAGAAGPQPPPSAIQSLTTSHDGQLDTSPPDQPLSDGTTETTVSSTQIVKKDYWQLAIDALQAEDHKGSIKKQIAVIQQEAAATGTTDFAELLLQATQQSQQDLEARRWKIGTGSWSIHVRQQLDRTIKALQIFREMSSPAYNVDPVHLGLPLAGLCVLMQLVTSDSEQYAAMLDGVAEIVIILTPYQHIEVLYLARPDEDLKQKFEQHLINLYKHIIHYQVSAINYYSRNTMSRFIRAVPKLDDISNIMSAIRREDGACSRIVLVFDSSDANKRHKEFLERFDQLEKSLASQRGSDPKWPVHWTVARSPNALFTGREDILRDLETSARSALNDGAPSKQSRSVIFGLGGQGKSEICLQLVQRVHPLFWSVFWVDVSTKSLAETAFLDIAKRLNVSPSAWQDGRQALANVQQPWMLILDNADDPEIDYQDYFPSSPHGVVVMTSRNQECQQHVTAERIALEGLPIKEARELLFRAANIEGDQRQALQEDSLKVAGILQSHPLALTLAGAYIRSGHCTLARYPDEYQRQRKRLLRFNSTQCRSRYRDVYATFEASVELLQEMRTETSKDALDLLPVLAVCAPNRIPLQLFEMAWKGAQEIPETATSEDDPENLGQWHVNHLLSLVQASTDQWDSFRLVEAVHLLEAFALLSTDTHEGEASLSMHPLVHAWARDRQDDHAQHDSWVSMGCIMALSIRERKYWRIHQRELRAHLQALTSWDIPCMFRSDPVGLVVCILFHCGLESLRMRDDMHLSMLMEKLFTYLGLSESTVDERWLDLYFLRAQNHGYCGQHKEAILILEHIVQMRKRSLAEDHKDLLESQHELARSYQNNGQIQEAISLLEKVVQIRAQTLAEDHPHRLSSQHELARAYKANGRIQEAISLLEKVVQTRAQTLTEDNSDRLASQYKLARAYQADGRIQEAISLLEKVIQIRAQTLAEDYPDRLSSQHELARAYQADGRIQEAISLLEKVVQIQAQTLAEDHLDRLSSQHNLATSLWDFGQTHAARQLMEYVVKVRRRTLHENHPSLVNSEDWLKYMQDEMQDKILTLDEKSGTETGS